MKASRNLAILLAMTSSLALLLVLQIFWLRNSYEKAYHDLKREANGLLHTTIASLRDSLFMRNIEPLDSLDSLYGDDRMKMRGSVGVLRKSISDSISISDRGESAHVIFFSAMQLQDDTIGDILKPMTTFFQNVKGQRSYMVRLTSDTLNTDSIAYDFRKRLHAAGINAGFDITRMASESVPFRRRFIGSPPGAEEGFRSFTEGGPDVFGDTLTTNAVTFNPMNRYAASLSGIRSLILKEISPQIIFSLFLTLLTAGSFLIMLRSIRTQQRLIGLKNDFINNVTHELKTPVATISAAIEAFQNFHALDKPDLTRDYLDIARIELNRLTLMTDKILKAAAFENKNLDLPPEPLDLDTLVQQVISSFKIVIEKTGALVTYNAGGDTALYGSSIHLTNVIYNLLDNALKYSAGKPVIGVSLTGYTDRVVLSVRDTGIGIAPEFHKKIFEKFFRIPTGDVHNVKGHGLGLSYVASVVRNHGGTVDVSAPSGGGSCFTLSLPKDKVPAA